MSYLNEELRYHEVVFLTQKFHILWHLSIRRNLPQ